MAKEQKWYYYKINVDANVSDEFVVRARTAGEAKRIAVQRFCKVRNFNFFLKRFKKREDAVEHWL